MTDSYVANIPQSEQKIPIDIIVPAHGKMDLTLRCVSAIYDRTTYPFHLIVLDDTPLGKNNPDALLGEYLKRLDAKHGNITYVHRKTPYREGNEFFNEGLKYCRHKFVAVIMNSITVDPEWELVAVNFMNNNPKVGVIGFKCLFPTGVIESAGIVMQGFTPIDIGRDSAGHSLSGLHECIAVQWAFALLRKEAVVGNLQEGVFHGFVGWDDIDNSFVIRSKGWHIFYCGLGSGTHEPRATRGKDTLDVLMKNRENAEKFYKRWGYWDLYQKANEAQNMHDKSKIVEEIRGLAHISAMKQ